MRSRMALPFCVQQVMTTAAQRHLWLLYLPAREVNAEMREGFRGVGATD
jgi:hypothetical protein